MLLCRLESVEVVVWGIVTGGVGEGTAIGNNAVGVLVGDFDGVMDGEVIGIDDGLLRGGDSD